MVKNHFMEIATIILFYYRKKLSQTLAVGAITKKRYSQKKMVLQKAVARKNYDVSKKGCFWIN